jgi:hypothetical protein
LCIGTVEGHALAYQAIDVRGSNVRVAEAPYGVEPLLIGAVPEYVGSFHALAPQSGLDLLSAKGENMQL